MDLLKQFIDFFLHLDRYLGDWIREYGTFVYAILFLIIFTETGLIVMPILPGDSLLFAIGIFCARGDLSIWLIIPLLITAALCGDNVNYFVGKFFGERIKQRNRILFFKKEYITRTETFYDKHGGKAIILARFVPIIRTIAPFVAGAGSMRYSRYILFCITGATLWVSSVTFLGYSLGSNEWVSHNFEKVIIGIIFISLIPVFWQIFKPKSV